MVLLPFDGMLRAFGYLAVVALFLFSWSSCTPRDSAPGGEDGEAAQEERREAEPERSDEPRGEENRGEKKRGEERTTLQPAEESDTGEDESTPGDGASGANDSPDGGANGGGAEAADGAEDRWPAHSRTRRVPEDVELGELEDLLRAPPDAVDAAAVIRELFGELSEERIPRELLVGEVREELQSRLEYMIERAPIAPAVRIGELSSLSESELRVPVVAFGAEGGRTTGEIYVAKRDGSWYILDILVDFSRISEDSETPIFEPGDTRPTLLNF